MTKARVLIVDDDPGFCTILSKILAEEDFDADSANNGQEGLNKMRASFYDLVVLDIKMPGMSGLEVLKTMRSFQAGGDESSVIMITGYVSNETPIDALKLGATDYLVKPFELNDFLRSVDRNVDLAKIKKERNAYLKELSVKNQELVAAFDELKKTRDRLLLTEKLAAVGQVASTVAHEIRNPLESIENYAYLLDKAVIKKDEKLSKYFAMLFKSMENAKNIVDELLNFSKDKKLNFIETSLSNIINDALETIQLPENISIVNSISKDAKMVMVDQQRIRQVITNLVINASQAMSEKGGIITISSREADEKVILSVSDTGSGMNEEKIKSIFDPFYTTKAKGIGLGLAIVREIVKKHNGDISVESKENLGTTFHITLPKNQPSSQV